MKKLIVGLLAASALVLSSAVAVAQQKTVRIASHVSKSSPLFANSEMFVERISQAYPDAFDFKFFPNGQLGKEQALIDNIKLGTLEMAMVASGVLKLNDKLGIFDLPWLFSDRAHVKRAVGGEFGQTVKGFLEEDQGFIVLGIYENGFRHVVNKKRAIKTPEDMSGLKIRVTGSKYKRNGFSAMGADPVPVAWQETFSAIQQGVVDGAEAALYGFYGAKLYEITNHLSLTSHTYSPSFLIASKTFWNSLSEDEQKTFLRVAKEMTDAAYAEAAELEKGYLEKMKSEIEVNEVDAAPFQKKAQSVYETYTSNFGTEWLKMIRSAQ